MTSAPTLDLDMNVDLDADAALADAFGHYVRRWSQERGASTQVGDFVRRAASLVSKATSEGHVCVHLRDVAQSILVDADETITVASLRDALIESRLVGSPQEPGAMPLILDDENRLYLHRYFDYERRLAGCLAQRRSRPGASVQPSVVPLLDTLFKANRQSLGASADWQKIAVLTALLGNLTIISGGPGTGKTTAIVNLLACLLAENPAARIALAAPTGKAAAGITEAIRRRASHLPEPIIALLPQKSFTVHRLLEVLSKGGFRHHAGNPLPIDVLIVDEASMLDLALATQLIEAVPLTARIVLVGDKDQLAAVESGAVFAELSADPGLSDERVTLLAKFCAVDATVIQAPGNARAEGKIQVFGLTDSVIWLKKNYRFAADSPIGRLAADINAGDAGAALARLRESTDSSLTWLNDGGALPSSDTIREICSRYAPYLEACRGLEASRSDGPDPSGVTMAFARFRTLCAVRDGPRGTHAINRLVGTWFRRELQHPVDNGPRSDWYPGRPVIVLRNDYVLKLYNGDIGIALPEAASGNYLVYFPDAEAGYRAIPAVRLPEHETAFAMTVHKAQGSEFDEVLVMLPAEPNRVLTRELLYTGVTRARERVIVMGGADVVEYTILAATDRVSGLLARMR